MSEKRKFLNKQKYDNIKMLSPEGVLMCYIGEKRAKWYLDRDLARKTGKASIQLKFKPNGLGNHGYPLMPLANRCVVCGCSDIEKLSKHHAIPECFRKHFPEEWKSYRSHEVIFLCLNCHETYEIEAEKLKEKIITPFGGSKIVKDHQRLRKYMIVVTYHRQKVTKEHLDHLEAYIKDYYGLDTLTPSVLKELLSIPRPNMYKIVADNMVDYHGFTETWKQHFVAIMRPKYLPDFWGDDYKEFYESNNSQHDSGILE